jgi:hypothetical protein
VTGDVGGEAAAQPGRRRPAIVPDPVIVVLLLIAFFSAISGKPLDGGLTLLVAAGLAWDVRTRGRHIPAAPAASEPPGVPVPDAAPPPPRRRAAVSGGWPRPDGGALPRTGVLLWGGVLVAGGLWELWSLFQQPAMDTTSYAHPTISALTDPVLAAQPGRVGMLVAWAWLGLHFFAK